MNHDSPYAAFIDYIIKISNDTVAVQTNLMRMSPFLHSALTLQYLIVVMWKGQPLLRHLFGCRRLQSLFFDSFFFTSN